MLRSCIVLCLLIICCSNLFAIDRGDCSPVFDGNITDSRIKLDCSNKLSLGTRYKLEELVNEKFSTDECSPEFKGSVKGVDLIIICGYPITDIQKIVDDFLIRFTKLKNKLATLQVTDAFTQELQKQADQAIDEGEFDIAQALIDEIIAAEEAVGFKALERIKALRVVFKDAQEDKAQASIDAVGVLIQQRKCNQATWYLDLANNSIATLNENSPEPIATLPMEEALLVEKVQECQKEWMWGELPLLVDESKDH